MMQRRRLLTSTLIRPRFFRPPSKLTNFVVTGVTRDSNGQALGNCSLDLFDTGTDTLQARTTSDAFGNYTFQIGQNAGFFYVVAYKAGSPDVAGTSVNFVVGNDAAVAPLNITADVWQDFNFTTLNTTNLDSNDHFATTGRWSITNPSSLLATSTTAEKALLSTVNGQTTAGGTRGITYNCNASGVAGFCQFNHVSAKLNVSYGFWFKFDSGFVSTFTEHDILTVQTTLGNKNIYIKAADGNVGSGIQSIHIFNPADSYSAGIIVVPNTWYWVNVSYADNNASGMKLRVFNDVGTQVGIENTRSTDADSGVINAVIGSLIGGNPFVGTLFFDNFIIDETNARYPFGP